MGFAERCKPRLIFFQVDAGGGADRRRAEAGRGTERRKGFFQLLRRRAAAAPHPQHPDAGDEVERLALRREGQGEVGGFGCISLFHSGGGLPRHRPRRPVPDRLPGQQGAADPLDALRLKDSAVLGLGPEVHGEEAVDVGGRRDDRHRAARFCQRPGQRVGTAQMARQERHGEVSALVHHHHRRVGGLAFAVGRDGPHRDAHSSHKNQGLVLCKMLRRPAFQGHVSAAAAHAAGQSFRQPMGQRLALCGEGQICPAHCPASVPCRNSVVKAGS